MAKDKNTSIVAAGKKFDIGCRVVLWNEEAGLSFYPYGGFTPRNISFKELQKKMKCFVLHHSVTYSSHATFRGLIGRGLSVNFIIDDDVNEDGYATVYQCLDIKDYGWSHKPLNDGGPGVEISYHPTAWTHPNMYSDKNVKKWGVQPHDVVNDRIRGRNFKVFAPTEAQVKSTISLMAGFCRAFPNVDPTFPRINNNIAKKTVDKNNGMLAHFQLASHKVDPMGFPFSRAERDIKRLNDTWHLRRRTILDKLLGWFK